MDIKKIINLGVALAGLVSAILAICLLAKKLFARKKIEEIDYIEIDCDDEADVETEEKSEEAEETNEEVNEEINSNDGEAQSFENADTADVAENTEE